MNFVINTVTAIVEIELGEIGYKEADVIRLLEFLGYPVKFGDE